MFFFYFVFLIILRGIFLLNQTYLMLLGEPRKKKASNIVIYQIALNFFLHLAFRPTLFLPLFLIK